MILILLNKDFECVENAKVFEEDLPEPVSQVDKPRERALSPEIKLFDSKPRDSTHTSTTSNKENSDPNSSFRSKLQKYKHKKYFSFVSTE